MKVFKVPPSLPTAVGDRSTQPLLGTDLWMFIHIENVHIIPERLDILRLSNALARTLSLFPTFAGRLTHDASKGSWSINLTNSPVPVYVEENPSYPAPEDDHVVIDTVHPFVVPLDLLSLVNHDIPLFNVKITQYEEDSVIGLMVSHMIADGSHVLSFTRALSEFYQGSPPDPSISYHVPEPLRPWKSSAKVNDPPSFWETRHFGPSSVSELYLTGMRDSASVFIRFQPHIAEKLLSISRFEAQKKSPQGNGSEIGPLSISRQDAVSAYVVSLMNRFLEKPVTFVTNNFNYRGVVDQVNISGNATAFIQTARIPPEHFTDMGYIAGLIRHSILSARATAFTTEELPLAQQTMMEVANQGRIYCVAPADQSVTINGNAQYDYNSAHFGHPGRTRFHTAWLSNRYVRVFRSNPLVIKNTDGSITLETREGHWDVQFKVDKEIHKKVLDAIKRDMDTLESTGQLAAAS